MNDIEQLLSTLLSPETSIRQGGETKYNEILDSNPSNLAVNLVETIKHSQHDEIKRMARVLLRQAVVKKWENFSPEFQNGLQTELVTLLEQSTSDVSAQKQVCQIVSNIPHDILVQWGKNLVPWSIQMCRERAEMRQAAVYLLGQLAEFGWESVEPQLSQVVEVLGVFIGNESDNALQLVSINTFTLLILSANKPRDFQNLVEASISTILKAIQHGLASGDVYSACGALENLTNIIKKCFWALDKDLMTHIRQLLEIVGNNNLESDGRAVALEALAVIIDKRAKVVVKDEELLKHLITRLIEAQCFDAEWEDEWDENGEPLATDLLVCGQKGLRGSSIAVLVSLAENCKQNILPVLFMFLPTMLKTGDWKQQFAALSSVAVLTEPQGEYMLPSIKELIQFIGPALNASDQRIKYADLACFNEILQTEKLAAVVRQEFGTELITTLVQSLNGTSNSCPMVQSCACVVISTFCTPNACPPEVILPQLDSMVEALVYCLTNGTVGVQEQAMIALQSIASVAGSEFGRFYDRLVPGIKNVIANSSGGSSPLRAAAMSCIAAVAEAVGPDRFQSDANEVMELLLKNNQGQSELEVEGIIDFSRRVCVVMNEKFLPYMQYVLPIILKSCSADMEVKCEKVIGDEGNRNGDIYADNETGTFTSVKNFHGVGQVKVSANLYAMQLCNLGLEAIDEMADTLQADFLPYLQESAKAVIPRIVDRFNVDASIKASEAAASLLFSLWKAMDQTGEGQQEAPQFLTTLMTPMLMGLELASDPSRSNDNFDWRSGYAAGIERCMRICYNSVEENNGAAILPPMQLLPQWTKALVNALQISVRRRATQEQSLVAEGYDNEDLEMVMEELNELEGEFAEMLVDSIGYMLKIHRENFLPVFDTEVYPFISEAIKPTQNAPLRHNAVCLVDDAIEFCSPKSHKYLEQMLPYLLQYISDDDLKLRQAAIYGLGQACQHAPQQFSPVAGSVGATLVALISNPGARDDIHINATENAISALGKVCKYHAQSRDVDVNQWLPFWVQQLPLTVDEEEAQFSHQLLCDCISQGLENNPILGSSFEHLPLVLKAIANILDMANSDDEDEIDVASAATLDTIPEILKGLNQNLPANVMNTAVQQLGDLKAVLERAIC